MKLLRLVRGADQSGRATGLFFAARPARRRKCAESKRSLCGVNEQRWDVSVSTFGYFRVFCKRLSDAPAVVFPLVFRWHLRPAVLAVSNPFTDEKRHLRQGPVHPLGEVKARAPEPKLNAD
jgi:hypothetical protein